MNIGTIVEAEMLRLRVGNRYLGNIEEWFISGLSAGTHSYSVERG